jgi:hypothetical protein
MRFIGLILALGAIGWVLYQASGGKDGDGAVPNRWKRRRPWNRPCRTPLSNACRIWISAASKPHPVLLPFELLQDAGEIPLTVAGALVLDI